MCIVFLNFVYLFNPWIKPNISNPWSHFAILLTKEFHKGMLESIFWSQYRLAIQKKFKTEFYTAPNATETVNCFCCFPTYLSIEFVRIFYHFSFDLECNLHIHQFQNFVLWFKHYYILFVSWLLDHLIIRSLNMSFLSRCGSLLVHHTL